MNRLVSLKDFTPSELGHWVQQQGEPPYRARQLLGWLYDRNAEHFQAMTDLSKDFRRRLTERAHISCLRLEKTHTDINGTRKLLYRLGDGEAVEGVLIRDGRRWTLCISSQVGCALGCRFCLSGQAGWRRNLSSGEIVDQVCVARRQLGLDEKLSNLVFMGMGEPLANFSEVLKALETITSEQGLNFSTRRVTLSTVGLIPELLELGRRLPIKLAVSLHAADSHTRSRLMPVDRRYPLEQLLEACRQLQLPPRLRLTFEYLLLAGVNDALAAARRLVRLLQGLRAKINLIPFNEYPGARFRRPAEERIAAFQRVLLEANFTATVRRSRGVGIMAACGQLSLGP